MKKVVIVLMLTALLSGAGPEAFLPSAWAGSYELGLKFYEQGQYTTAADYFLRATREDNSNTNAHYYLADSFVKMNRLAEAQAEYQKILAMAPNSQAARFSRIGLSRIRSYLDATIQRDWQVAGTRGGGDRADSYQGQVTEDHYISEVTENGRVVRWSLKTMPLKLYIERSPQGIRNFQPAFIAQAQKAMDVWVNALDHQLTYTLVDDPEKADIRVYWTNTIDTRGHSADGGTAYTAGITVPKIRDEELKYSDVKIATFDILGNAQNPDVVYAVAIHEYGHALGLLGHSSNPKDIMYAQNQDVNAPSKRDIMTLRKLYTLTADIDNRPAASRQKEPGREAEIARKMDAHIKKMEAQAQKDGMALTWLNLGVAYFQKGKQTAKSDAAGAREWFQKALRATDEAIRLEPKDPRAYHKRSLANQELGDIRQALADIQTAINLDRREPEYYMLKSWYLAKLGDVAASRSALDTYLLYKPGEANSSDVSMIREEWDKQRRAK